MILQRVPCVNVWHMLDGAVLLQYSPIIKWYQNSISIIDKDIEFKWNLPNDIVGWHEFPFQYDSLLSPLKQSHVWFESAEHTSPAVKLHSNVLLHGSANVFFSP